jgi:precorrin-6Y C5,15-methyltransferase (decarboxylating)
MITVIGFDGSALPSRAAEALAAATLVVGGKRHLDAVAVPENARRHVMGPLSEALAVLDDHTDEDGGPAVVLASGDPGFFGIVRALRERGFYTDVVPARSSVALAFASVGLPWDDAIVVSAHGRDIRRAANVCRSHHKVAVLTGPDAGPRELAQALRGVDRTFVVAEYLGQVGERIHRTTPAEAEKNADWVFPNVVLVLDAGRSAGGPGPGWLAGSPAGPHGWAVGEESFVHRDSMITKAEARALVLARLGPRRGDLVWDVGAGSGSVAVECARFGAAAVAVDRDDEACERIGINAAGHGVYVDVVHGIAPACLLDLPQPDAVFVGGGGVDVVKACAERGPRAVVVTLAAVDRVAETWRALRQTGYHADGVLLQSSRLQPLPGEAHRLAATNPVFVLWGERL